jgi:hypothetical protein
VPSLIFTAGPLAGRRVDLGGQLVIGRDEGADVVVADPELSRRHAAVRPSGDAVEVEDLGSLNGTWLNGERIQAPVLLTPGDVVHLGTSEFELATVPASARETIAAAPPPAPAPAPAPPRAPAPVPVPVPAPVPAPLPAPAAGPVAAMPAFVAPPAGGHGIATRRLTPTVLAFAVVVATAVALVIYFAAR